MQNCLRNSMENLAAQSLNVLAHEANTKFKRLPKNWQFSNYSNISSDDFKIDLVVKTKIIPVDYHELMIDLYARFGWGIHFQS